jgi:hypothetical protein
MVSLRIPSSTRSGRDDISRSVALERDAWLCPFALGHTHLRRDPPTRVLTPSGAITRSDFSIRKLTSRASTSLSLSLAIWRHVHPKATRRPNGRHLRLPAWAPVLQPTSSAGANVGTYRYCGQRQSDLLTPLRQALAEERTLFLPEPRTDPLLSSRPPRG